RTLALEADPRSEQVLVIAEQAGPRGEWTIARAERRSGPEADLDTDDVLGAVRLRDSDVVTLFVDRRNEKRSELIQYARDGNGSWTRPWARESVMCSPS